MADPRTDPRIVAGARLGGKQKFARYGDTLTAEDRSLGGVTCSHLKYHSKIFNPKCPLCIERAESVEAKNGNAK